ncbi:acyl carrier protein [Nocardia terpenica]|uniref:acyl carrier protein n=1 Tax=Nocardia terpenica TaxID=455432 RepID=UPI002FE41D78
MITATAIADLFTGLDIDIDPATLAPSVPLDQQGLDSMDITTLLVAVEKAFAVKIPTASADDMLTLNQLAHHINSVRP